MDDFPHRILSLGRCHLRAGTTGKSIAPRQQGVTQKYALIQEATSYLRFLVTCNLGHELLVSISK